MLDTCTEQHGAAQLPVTALLHFKMHPTLNLNIQKLLKRNTLHAALIVLHNGWQEGGISNRRKTY